MHYLDADHRQHFAGVDSPEARHAFEQIDGFVGELRKAAREAGVADETVFVVVGDHGFVPVHTNVNLNVNALLLATGFAKLAGGKIVPSPDLTVAALGGSAALDLREGADPALGLASTEGTMLVAIDSPLPILPTGDLRGMHGYLPSMPAMATGFIAAGPGIRRGIELPVVRQLDVAPTVAALLGVPLEHALGLPIPGVLESRESGPGIGIGQLPRPVR